MGKRVSATIKDVAKLAGVSVATVSRVVNKLGVVNEETERKVLSAMAVLHYQPNAVARSLKLKETKTIGIIVPELSNTFFTQMIEHLEEVLGPKGYTLLVCSSAGSIAEERSKLGLLLERNVDGLIIIPAGDTGLHFEAVRTRGTPFVMIDRKIEGLGCDVVLTDNRKGAFEVTSALIREGRSRIGFLGGNPHIHTSVERLHGFLDAMRSHNLAVEKEFILLGGMTQKAGNTLMAQALSMDNCPDAFFMVNDMVHIGSTSYLLSSSTKEVRSRMAFAAFDYLFYAPLLRFCHYAVAQPHDRIGEEAAKLLIRRMEGDNDGYPSTIVLEPTVVALEENGAMKIEGPAWPPDSNSCSGV